MYWFKWDWDYCHISKSDGSSKKENCVAGFFLLVGTNVVLDRFDL